MKVAVYHFLRDHLLAKRICSFLSLPCKKLTLHTFPDKETLVELREPCHEEHIFLLATIEHPNEKVLPLLFAAETLRSMGAKKITLIAPYLPYMRQDKAFRAGEGISQQYFAKLLSYYFDGLITIDPHLHRINDLNAVFSIPTQVMHAAPLISTWLKSQPMNNHLLIGPDAESKQWVEVIAKDLNVPYAIFNKTRHDDHHVEMTISDISQWKNHTPIIVDDIISTGQTLIQASQYLLEQGLHAPIIIAIHGLFASSAYQDIKKHCQAIYTTNTILHETNSIEITPLLIDAMKMDYHV